MKRVSTHPLSVGYLVVGLVYLGIAGSWALRTAGVVDAGVARWLLPLTLVVAGAVGLVAFGARGARRRGLDEDVDSPEDIYALERAAFAPYERDVERTRILDGQASRPDAPAAPDDRNGEHR
jgi:hypothetical protein